MDFDQLITFLEVARQGSFSRAGEKVFRSQSAVSAQIRQLEQEYGDRLLDRSGKSVKLTPAGQVFHDYAVRMKKLRDESLVAVAEFSENIAANIPMCKSASIAILPTRLSKNWKTDHSMSESSACRYNRPA
jgi:DNA-binding transcriptional LysR family regulator